MHAFEFGGGVELLPTGAFLLRIDLADRMLKYPGPSISVESGVHDDPFWGHAIRFTIGAGIRF
jgi:hypothetical protein